MLNLYAETAVHLALSPSDPVISISLPSTSNLQLFPTRGPQPKSSPVPTQAKDESTYARQFLATQGSVYFRCAKSYPRTFVWRVLDGNKILELRCADLVRSEHESDEALLTIRFGFQDSILPGGVALSDVQDQNVLHVFIITAQKELHTLAVPVDLFRNVAVSAGDCRRWCKTFVPSSFTIDMPHRFYAHTPFELFVSLDSGRLQRLTRKMEDDGSYWTQDNFDEKSWGASLRGIVKWPGNQFISYGSRSLSHTTANAMLASSDSTYLYTICLNHTLRVWSLNTGKLVVSKDLLDQMIRPQDPHNLLSPATSSFLRLLISQSMRHPILVTFSPHNEGQFKFWNTQDGLSESLVIKDMFPDITLKAPDPDPSGNTIWSLAGFEIYPGGREGQSELWLLWRNNNFYQVYSLRLDLHDVIEGWEMHWVKMETPSEPKYTAPDFVRHDPVDPTEKWMKFLFWPERYPPSVLETSLNIYQEAMRIKPASSKSSRPLQERLWASITSGVSVRKYSDAELDYSRFSLDTDTEWRNFWRVAEAINEKRKSPLSLAVDTYAGMAVVLQSDRYCVLRECNEVELLLYNRRQSLQPLQSIISKRWPHRRDIAVESQTLDKMTQLLDVAGTFTRSFSSDLTRGLETALVAELLEVAEYPIPDRISDFYERCNFADAVSNEAYEHVLRGIDGVGGLQALGTELIPTILALLPENVRGSHTALRSTIFGSKIVDAGLGDTITLGRHLVYSLLVLVVFLECEIDQEETRPDGFDAAELFSLMLAILKEYDKKVWLLSHVRDVPLENGACSGGSVIENNRRSSTQSSPPPLRQVTLLRDTKGKDIKPQPAVDSPQSYLLTEMLSDVEAWVGGASEISADDGFVWIQCDLLAHGNVELATEFSRFQPNTAWSTYVKGRLCLARNEHEQAALYFQKAAFPLGESIYLLPSSTLPADLGTAHGKAIGMLSDMSAGLLTVEDTDYFHSGISRYFQHILVLFESSGVYSFAADFARLALVAIPRGPSERAAEDQDDILSSLFTAELHCSRYVSAYAALTQFSNEQLQERFAIAWADAILHQSPVASLQAKDTIQLLQMLPLDLQPRVARLVEGYFTTLAQKQAPPVPGVSGRIWSTNHGPDYLKILYALHVGRRDYRGALSVLMDRLHLVKKSNQTRNDPQATMVRNTLLAIINILSCVGPDEAYILAPVRDTTANTINGQRDPEGRDMDTGWKTRKKIIITLEDLRREYQQLLDRCSRIERGDFDFDAAIEGEEDESDFEGTMATHGIDAMEV